MLDIKFLRENPELVKENIRKKFQDSKLPLVDEVIALDGRRQLSPTRASNSRVEEGCVTILLLNIGSCCRLNNSLALSDIRLSTALGARRYAYYNQHQEDADNGHYHI